MDRTASRRRALALTALLAAGAAGLVACGDSETTASRGDGPLVVVTTTQLADFARVLGGDDVEVHSMLQANSDAHDFEPSPRDLDALARATVIVENGLGPEPWLEDAVEASGTDAEVVDASEGARLLEGGHSHGEDDAHSEDEAHTDEEGAHSEDEAHAEEEGDAHDHEGEYNPHLWFDPENAAVMVGHVADALVEAAPDAETAIRDREEAYLAELDELDGWIDEQISGLDDPKLVTDHDAFTYFTDRYDITSIGSILDSFDTSAEVSAADLEDLAQRIEEAGVRAIFTEQSMPARSAEALARRTGVEVVSGDDGLYSDSLGPEGSAGETYLGMMRHNTETIVEHLS